jgi:antitoxin component of MazEF toxin-antitoxin module
MRKTLSRHGNSYALVLERSIMDLLHITPDTPLDITTDGTTLTISPQRVRRITPQELQEHTKLAMERFAPTLKNLAK